MMAKQTLIEHVEELRGALEKANDLDKEKSYLIGGLLSEIVESATSGEKGEEAGKKYSESLQEQVIHFEAEHPKIAEMLGRLATMLSSLGI